MHSPQWTTANCGFAKGEDGKAVGPWGKTNLSVTLGHGGHTKSVTIPEPFDGKPTGKCAVKAFEKLTFSVLRGGKSVPIKDWKADLKR